MRHKRLTLGAICVALGAVGAAVPSLLDNGHAPLTKLLRSYVRQEPRVAANRTYVRTVVKYGALKGNPNWTEYIRQLAYVDPNVLKSATPEARKAFWINSYNSFVVDAVVQNYPLTNGATNAYPAGSLRGSVAWSAPHFAGAQSFTLDSIRAMLQEFRDPRVFFAINDGAMSSAALPDKPYDATNVDLALDQATENFLADPLNFRLDRDHNRLVLSQIFRVNAQAFHDAVATIPAELAKYPEEFRPIIAFLLPRIKSDYRDFILARKPMIEWQPYSWELNAAN